MKHVAFIGNPLIRVNQRIAIGLTRELQRHGAWHLRMIPDAEPLTLRKHLGTRQPDAIVFRTGPLDPERRRILLSFSVRLVSVAVDMNQDLPLPAVVADQAAIGEMAAEYLLSQRFEHFAVVDFDRATVETRIASFCDAIHSAHKTLDSFLLQSDTTVKDHPFGEYRDTRKLASWLESLPKPCAILCHSDIPGTYVIDTCAQRGIPVPEDISVLGVDNDALFCHSVYPNLASINIPHGQIGVEAARLILNWKPGRRLVHVPPTAVIERGSVRPPTADDPLVNKAQEYVLQHTAEGVRVRDLQKLTGLSPQMLVHRYRMAIRTTPMEEILRHRISLAHQLLSETEEPVKVIAHQCGFNSANQFYVAFRKHTGTSPKDYRTQLK